MNSEAEQLDARPAEASIDASHPAETEASLRPSTRLKLVYGIVGLLSLLYFISCVAFAAVYEPNLQFFTYYAVNYDQGFVRRGLGGEILHLFPGDHYFTGLLILRWLVPAFFGVGIASVAWAVGFKFGRSERRLMLALLIPLLPLGIAHAIVLPTPDLVGEAVLAVFVAVLAIAKTDRSLLVASAIYGTTTAVLTLIHEAIPFLQALGAVLAIVVLVHSSTKLRQVSALLAVAPGLAVALAIALLRRQDVSAYCAGLPHKIFAWSPGQSVNGQPAYTDYHDWTCRFITVTSGKTPFVRINTVGWAHFVESTIAGIFILVLTVALIGWISGVPFRQFCETVKGQVSWVILAALLLLPIFATSADWGRWWVAISFDVGIVYLLYASRQPESTRPATRRTRVAFAVAMVFLALFPMLIGARGEQSVHRLVARCPELSSDPMWVGICP